jgi:23S rRNA-/tRNA-specific pseudouridylate synthase
VIVSAGNYTAVEAKPATGRTHQIRAHLAALGHPIACDPLYGRKGKNDRGIFLSSFKRNWRGDAFAERPLLARLGLHALKLEIPASVLGTPLALEAPLSRDMAALLKQMKANR